MPGWLVDVEEEGAERVSPAFSQGDEVIIVPAVSDAEAKEKFPAGWKSPKPHIRIVPQPQ